MNDLNDLITLIKSRAPIIVVETVDEMRVIELIRYAATHLQQDFYYWSIADGMSIANRVIQHGAGFRDPGEMLENIFKLKGVGVYLLVDFHPFINDPKHIRIIKELAINFESRRQTIIFLSHKFEIPQELITYTARFELQLPDRELIKKIIVAQAKKWSVQNGGKTINISNNDIYEMSRILYGLSNSEIERMVAQILCDPDSKNRLASIGRMKFESFRQTGVLTYEQDISRLSEVGGFRCLKEWLQKRRIIFLGDKKVSGLDVPKGILLIGVQGGGKSLAAKAVAGTWGIPLLRLDIGALYDKWAGETERKTRDSLKMAERMSPCVLWIDEIEKGVSTDGGSDSGLSQRVLGTLLTWMSERKNPVFVVATANDIEKLPPELLRKGRFDEVFFVDLPDEEMRKEIFSIHLKKRGFDPAGFSLSELSGATEGFSGAEIEQAIVAALYSMVGGAGNLTNELLMSETRATKPLSVLMAEKVAALRAWAVGRTVLVN